MKRLLIITVLLMMSLCCFAQRTSSGQPFISAELSTPLGSRITPGASLHAGQYLLDSYWSVGVAVQDYFQPVVGSDQWFDYMDIAASAGWMYRLAGTYSRSCNLYAGGDILLGYKDYETFHQLPSYLNSGLPEGEFIYGVRASLEGEWFVLRRTALTFSMRVPLLFATSLENDRWHLLFCFGLRQNF